MKTITLSMLKDKYACSAQVETFKRLFGQEVEVSVKACVKVASVFDWNWAAENLLSPDFREKYKVAHASLEAKETLWKKYKAAKAKLFAKLFLKMET